MEKIFLGILIFFVSSFSILNGAEYYSNQKGTFVKVKGILRLVNEDDDSCGSLFGIRFYAENKKDFEGKLITLYGDNIDYYSSYNEYIHGDGDIYLENDKLIKRSFPKKYEEIVAKLEKNIMVEIPVIVTINLSNIKTFSECDYTTVYTKVDKIEEIEKATKRKTFNEDSVSTYVVYTKDKYANMRREPNVKSTIIKKIPNNSTGLKYILTIGEWHYFYVNEFGQGESYGGFIHKSQVEKLYQNFIINSKEGYTNVREKPNSKSKIIKQLINGEKVKKVDNEGEWIEIILGYDNYNSEYVYGYIHRSQLKLVD